MCCAVWVFNIGFVHTKADFFDMGHANYIIAVSDVFSPLLRDTSTLEVSPLGGGQLMVVSLKEPSVALNYS